MKAADKKEFARISQQISDLRVKTQEIGPSDAEKARLQDLETQLFAIGR